MQTAQGLWQQFKVLDLKHICTDYDLDYRQIVPKHMHVETKSETATIEDLNSRIRHHLMRFRRKKGKAHGHLSKPLASVGWQENCFREP